MDRTFSPKELAGHIDHTLLKAEATSEQVLRVCDEARSYEFAAVCLNGRWVSLAAERLQGTSVKIAAVASFPLGADTTQTKVAQTKDLVYAGADEIDMVADLAAIIEADGRYLLHQFGAVLDVCRSMKPAVALKVIIESAALTADQKVFVCQIADQAGIDIVKTSTGFHPAGGATLEDVALMKQSAPRCRVKASGGIRTAQQALAMLEAGAERIGTSAGVQIMRELSESGGS